MPACQKLPAWFGDSVTRDDDSVSCVRSPPPTASDRQSLPPPRQVVVVDFSDACLSRIHCSLRRTGSRLKSSTQSSTGVTQSKSYNGYPDVQTLVSSHCRVQISLHLHTYRVSLRSSFAYNSVNGCSMAVAVEFEK